MQLKLLDKYIFKQVFGASFVCIALFTIIWLAPEKMVNVIKLVSSHEMSSMTGLKYLIFSVPFVLSKAFPVGILLGSLYAFNRMSKDSELTVIRGCGISFWRIAVMPIVLGIFFTIFCFILCDRVIPYSDKKIDEINVENSYNHFVYGVKDADKNLEQLVIVKTYDNLKNISGTVVLNFNKKNKSKVSILSDIIISEKAVPGELKWDLYGNSQYIIKYDGVYDRVQSPEKISILHGQSAKTINLLMQFGLKKDRDLTNAEMRNYMKILKAEDINDSYSNILNKYLQRFFHSAMCILFAILGCLLGYCNPREQKLIGFTIAIGIIFLYYMSLNFTDVLAEKQILSPLITATFHPLLIAILIKYYKKYKGL